MSEKTGGRGSVTQESMGQDMHDSLSTTEALNGASEIVQFFQVTIK